MHCTALHCTARHGTAQHGTAHTHTPHITSTKENSAKKVMFAPIPAAAPGTLASFLCLDLRVRAVKPGHHSLRLEPLKPKQFAQEYSLANSSKSTCSPSLKTTGAYWPAMKSLQIRNRTGTRQRVQCNLQLDANAMHCGTVVEVQHRFLGQLLHIPGQLALCLLSQFLITQGGGILTWLSTGVADWRLLTPFLPILISPKGMHASHLRPKMVDAFLNNSSKGNWCNKFQGLTLP